MIIERRPPHPFEAPFDAALPGGSNIVGQREQILRQLQAVEQQPEYWLRLDYHLLHLQRRVLDYKEHWQAEAISSHEMNNLLARAKYDAQMYGADGSHSETLASIDALTFAYTAFAFPTFKRHQQMVSIQLYNHMQQEQIEATGEPLRGAELYGQQVTTLAWLLDQSGIPHSLSNADICVPFASMEGTMRQVAQEQGASPYKTPAVDHEATSNVYDLMHEWQNSQGDTGQS
jgi:hypothetical protein